MIFLRKARFFLLFLIFTADSDGSMIELERKEVTKMTAVTFNTCLLLAVLGVLTFSCWRKYRLCQHLPAHK